MKQSFLCAVSLRRARHSLSRWHVLLVGLAIFLPGMVAQAGDKRKGTGEPSSYVKLEVKGKLVRQENGYFIKAKDAVFPGTEVLVRLERSEDKDRELDEHLKSLEGKLVVAEGFLDCRRINGEKRVIELHLSNEKQVRAAGKR
ncbi:MAG TPA: hypothetical protein VG013_12310 [Gemmataceae bacterium]|jgi:hypothetical protein|nr:hypothetical protein [Gemmataceae bacterium]